MAERKEEDEDEDEEEEEEEAAAAAERGSVMLCSALCVVASLHFTSLEGASEEGRAAKESRLSFVTPVRLGKQDTVVT